VAFGEVAEVVGAVTVTFGVAIWLLHKLLSFWYVLHSYIYRAIVVTVASSAVGGAVAMLWLVRRLQGMMTTLNSLLMQV